MERTAGKLEQSRRNCQPGEWIFATGARVGVPALAKADTAANASHLAACWNAVEEHAGGKPELLTELVALAQCVADGTLTLGECRRKARNTLARVAPVKP